AVCTLNARVRRVGGIHRASDGARIGNLGIREDAILLALGEAVASGLVGFARATTCCESKTKDDTGEFHILAPFVTPQRYNVRTQLQPSPCSELSCVACRSLPRSWCSRPATAHP